MQHPLTLCRQSALVGLCLVLVLVTSASAGEVFTGTVVAVTDGDTISVVRHGFYMHDATPEKVRLAGIDAPEKTQPWGVQAHLFMQSLVHQQNVTVTVEKTDRYGRLVSTVHVWDSRMVESRNVGHELVRAGLAWWYRQYAPKDLILAQLEAEARAAGRGLWAHSNPIAPWAWRKGTR